MMMASNNTPKHIVACIFIMQLINGRVDEKRYSVEYSTFIYLCVYFNMQ